MKRRTVRRVKIYLTFTIIMVLCVSIASNSYIFAYPVKLFANTFTSSAISLVLPFSKSAPAEGTQEKTEKTTSKANTQAAATTQSSTKKQAQTEKTDDNETVLANGTEYGGRVLSYTIDKSGATMSYGDVYVKNKTEKTIDIKTGLSNKPELKIKLNSDKPQVLIVHTHATECFFPKITETYPSSWGERDNDTSKNMVAVGKVLAKTLNNAGIKTVQSEVLHDKESYTGSYDRSRETIKKYLKKYPSIKVVLDVHRDAINEEDGDKIRPIVDIKNKTAAQIMIISGCESGPITDYPNWRKNLRFALGLQQKLEQTYPNLARPLFFAEKKYNQDLCPNSILIEVGSQANLLSEAKYSATLFGGVLAKYLKNFT